MNHPVVYALLACAIAVIGEALLMGKDGSRFLKGLKQPAFAPPFWVWTLIGFGYYVLCFLSIYRLTSGAAGGRMALGFLLVVMAANTFWNYLYFRLRDMRLAFWFSVGYAGLVVALVVALLGSDAVVALAFAAYLAYLPYALVLGYRTWKLNLRIDR